MVTIDYPKSFARRNEKLKNYPRHEAKKRAGFALVATLMLMVLLLILAIGLLSLSTVSLRSSSADNATAEAQANARLALIYAIGKLQNELGPDMRISSQAALHDSDPSTAAIDGIQQPNWLASYNAWGDWLNASYTTPDGATLEISDTYGDRRSAMFRRWLVSLPIDQETNINAAGTGGGLDESNSVILVGGGSLGAAYIATNPEQVTRAYLTKVGDRGRFAWWIGPENHKAQINLASKNRTLAADEWATSQGTTAQVSVGAISGMDALDANTAAMDQLVSKVVSLETLSVPALNVETDVANSHFFDLTNYSKGILTSVRTGGLKKDLSLLLDRDNANLPAAYKFVSGAGLKQPEPSIRPLSADILDQGAVLPKRPFASWTAMRHYYRMYRTTSDINLFGPGTAYNNGGGSLSWNGQNPYTKIHCTRGISDDPARWTGQDTYMRLPLIAKFTFIYSLVTEPNPLRPGERYVRVLFSPVVTLWNPYNTEMRFPSRTLAAPAQTNGNWPTDGYIYINGVKGPSNGATFLGNVLTYFNSETGAEIVIKPGEFKVFSQRSVVLSSTAGTIRDLYPGFDPSAIGGSISDQQRSYLETEIAAQRIGAKLNFGTTFAYNRQVGQTPGSFSTGLSYGNSHTYYLPCTYSTDWFNESQMLTDITSDITPYSASAEPVIFAYTQFSIKGMGTQPDYESINWEKDWRCRNWIQSPPSYFGSGLYMSENEVTGHTQRLDSPYNISFGPISALELPKVVGHIGERAFLGSGSNPYEKVTAVPALELPTAPISNLAGFSGMRMSPGWIWAEDMNPDVSMRVGPRSNWDGGNPRQSLVAGNTKRIAYQSGITGPGIGNSFMHPMIPRTGVYQFHNNSISQDRVANYPDPVTAVDTKAYSDYWDHVLLLNDALWDDYYVSTLANQTRTGAPSALNLSQNIDRLTSNQPIANPRLEYYGNSTPASDVKAELLAEDGYLKSASHLLVDGAFNVNSTSVAAWQALFAGIRERQIYYRKDDGSLAPVEVPASARIALSRFDTPNADEEVTNPSSGVSREDGNQTWSGVRFLTDAQILLLAEKCVEQVKKRGPFLNFSEFINRRLSDDELGTMGALQSAIDYDDKNPDPASINYLYKRSAAFMISESDLGNHEFQTPEAAEGSRLAGTPGYVIQSDLLKPIASTLTVRDDTFRIRTYGESLDKNGNVQARAWCEAVVQRVPNYYDSSNSPEVPARIQNSSGNFEDNPVLSELNRSFGRKFEVISFRWLNSSEI